MQAEPASGTERGLVAPSEFVPLPGECARQAAYQVLWTAHAQLGAEYGQSGSCGSGWRSWRYGRACTAATAASRRSPRRIPRRGGRAASGGRPAAAGHRVRRAADGERYGRRAVALGGDRAPGLRRPLRSLRPHHAGRVPGGREGTRAVQPPDHRAGGVPADRALLARRPPSRTDRGPVPSADQRRHAGGPAPSSCATGWCGTPR